VSLSLSACFVCFFLTLARGERKKKEREREGWDGMGTKQNKNKIYTSCVYVCVRVFVCLWVDWRDIWWIIPSLFFLFLFVFCFFVFCLNNLCVFFI